MKSWCRLAAIAIGAALFAHSTAAQTIEIVSGEAVIGPVVTGAPFSANAYTKVNQTLGDGTKVTRNITAKFYRDAQGRVRREQTIIGLEPLTASGESQLSVVIVDPVADVTYVISPVEKTVTRRSIERRGEVVLMPDRRTRLPGSITAFGLASQPASRLGPFRGRVELLGKKELEGVVVSGTRLVHTAPAGVYGNDRPIETTDERWEADELKVLVLSRHHDPWTGDVEYGLTNIRRGDPPADLFTVPANYTVVPPR